MQGKQEVDVAEQGTAGQSKREAANAQIVETKIDDLGRT